MAVTAHPRSRGENAALPVPLGDVARLIPAHAGKTSSCRSVCGRGAAHPRSRGENRLLLPQRPVERGSSPLTRGKRGPLPRPLGRVRLIPAHAGKTVKFGYTNRDGSAHPRSRGENGLGVGRLRCGCGSSPLTRGKLVGVDINRSILGLIPAHAGKTPCPQGYAQTHGAHPRSRGENVSGLGGHFRSSGSSPLTRGKHCRLTKVRRMGGLIPAHAGKTAALAGALTDSRAHPRSRGENGQPYRRTSRPRGSSPLTRGKRFHSFRRRNS